MNCCRLHAFDATDQLAIAVVLREQLQQMPGVREHGVGKRRQPPIFHVNDAIGDVEDPSDKSVVFPEPDGPVMMTISPARTTAATSNRICFRSAPVP